MFSARTVSVFLPFSALWLTGDLHWGLFLRSLLSSSLSWPPHISDLSGSFPGCAAAQHAWLCVCVDVESWDSTHCLVPLYPHGYLQWPCDIIRLEDPALWIAAKSFSEWSLIIVTAIIVNVHWEQASNFWAFTHLASVLILLKYWCVCMGGVFYLLDLPTK